MLEIDRLTDPAAVDAALERSREHPVLVFKHSLTCPISDSALRQFERYLSGERAPGLECLLIEVQPGRAASNRVEERSGVRHESPQALLFVDGNPVWNASHGAITEASLREATSA